MGPNNNEKQYDINMMFVVFLFAVVSCFYVYLAQQQPQYDTNFLMMHIVFYIISFIIALIVLHFDFEYYLSLHWLLYGFGLLMLIILALSPESIAPEINGAQRWFDIGPINLQPSEFMRMFIIITLSAVVYKHNNIFTSKNIRYDIWLLVKLGAIVIPPILLLLTQTDMGMVMMMAAIAIGITLISGITYKLLAPLYGIPALIMGTFIVAYFRYPDFTQSVLFDRLPDYQVSRLHGWLGLRDNPEEGFQAAQAMTAIGSGRLTGTSDHDVYFPEAHTDLIFAVVGMETGFIGTAIVTTLFFILVYQIMMTAIRCHHSFGTYICVGIITLVTFQVFQNIGMTLGILPITGFTLPFISYGGSSLLSSLLSIGLVLGVHYNSKSYFFKSEN